MDSKNATSKGAKARETLIRAAIALIARCGGAEKVTVRDIAREAGFTSPMIVYHFKTKNDLLDAVLEYVEAHRSANPVAGWLHAKNSLLETRDGQIAFITGLMEHFCSFFRELTEDAWSYSVVYRILQGTESNDDMVVKVSPGYFKTDVLAFFEIYHRITGDDDFDQAFFIFSTVFLPLALRLSQSGKSRDFDENHVLSECCNERFAYFCMRQLLIGLHLWESQGTEALAAAKQAPAGR